MAAQIVKLIQTGSTNRDARAWIATGRLDAATGRLGTLLVAERQAAGIGRFGRSWSSPVGGLWCTLARPVEPGEGVLHDDLGLRVGVACVEFVRALAGPAHGDCVRLKWPNDVMVDGLKVLGVLCERVAGPAGAQWLLVGVGLNANFIADELPPEIRSNATSLRTALGVIVDLDAAAEDLARRLNEAIDAGPLSDAGVAAARSLLFGLGQAMLVSLPTGVKTTATLIALDRDGHAVLEQDGSRWAAPSSVMLGG